MRTLTAIFSTLFLTYLISCSNPTSDTSVSRGDTLVNQKATLVDTLQNLPKPEQTAIAFLKWYRDNRDKLSSIRLINNASGENFDSTKFYSVNFPETERYLSAIKTSSFVSNAYIDNWKKYFSEADNQFKANPQNDGPPDGFDYDFIMQSQEIDQDLATIDKAKVSLKVIQGDIALLTLSLPSGQKLKITLSRQNQNWLIDRIESANG